MTCCASCSVCQGPCLHVGLETSQHGKHMICAALNFGMGGGHSSHVAKQSHEKAKAMAFYLSNWTRS